MSTPATDSTGIDADRGDSRLPAALLNQVECPPEANQVINENFWELVEVDESATSAGFNPYFTA